MRFYSGKHEHYCGIDLHARSLYVCVVDGEARVLLHRNLPAEPQALLAALLPFREGLVVAAECMHCWYWVADLCAEEGIPFVLGHALFMKAIHGAKAKNDRIRLGEDRSAPALWTHAAGLCLPTGDALYPGPLATTVLSRPAAYLAATPGK